MATTNPNSSDVLRAEILATARRESAEIVQRTQQETTDLLGTARAEAEKIRREGREQARAEAAHRKELILATVAVETGRQRSARTEALLESIHAEIRRRLLAPEFDRHEAAVALAVEAIRGMRENSFILKIPAADLLAFGNTLTGEITRRAGRSPLTLTLATDGAMAGGGVIIRDAAGVQQWDNRLLARLERLWPELRRQIAARALANAESNSAEGEK